jgi:hypothetical protein
MAKEYMIMITCTCNGESTMFTHERGMCSHKIMYNK